MPSVLRQLLAATVAGAFAFAAPLAYACCSPEGPEEFVGPFANWLNVQTTSGCGATGDGSTNNSTAIQNRIAKLTSAQPVLYFPHPTSCYKITTGLTFNAASFYMLIGENPANTSICTGTSSMTMLQINGTRTGTVNRFTFNGESLASTIVNQSWDGTTGVL